MVAHDHTSDFPFAWLLSRRLIAMSCEGAASTEVEKHELVPQLQMPPGHRFVPSDEEVVAVYLRRKIEGKKLPLDVVNEVKLLDWQPGRLVETYKAYGENKWYFFTVREPSLSKKDKEPNRQVRVSGVKGTWKATGSVTRIYKKGTKELIATKRALGYQSSDAEEDGKWSMNEYVLTSNSQIGQYALCTIQRKQHSDKEDEASGSSKRKRETINKEPGKTARRNNAVSPRQQKQETTTPQLVPPQSPLTPPKEDHLAPQQGSPPEQGYPSDGNQELLGVSAPTSAWNAQACRYDQQCSNMDAQLTFCGQPPSLIWSQSLSSDSNRQYQLYQQQENHGSFGVPNQLAYTGQHVGFFPTENNSNWELGQDKIYQQGGGNVFPTENNGNWWALALDQIYQQGGGNVFPAENNSNWWDLGQDQIYQQGEGNVFSTENNSNWELDQDQQCEGNIFGVQDTDASAQDLQSNQLQDHGTMFRQEPSGHGSHDQFTITSSGDSAASKALSISAAYESPDDLDIFLDSLLADDAPEAARGQCQQTGNGFDEGPRSEILI